MVYQEEFNRNQAANNRDKPMDNDTTPIKRNEDR